MGPGELRGRAVLQADGAEQRGSRRGHIVVVVWQRHVQRVENDARPHVTKTRNGKLLLFIFLELAFKTDFINV